MIAAFLSRSSRLYAFLLAEERPEISEREVPCRKKGRPKKKKDTKKKDKEGKPVKIKKRKKIVSLLSCRALCVVFLFLGFWLRLTVF